MLTELVIFLVTICLIWEFLYKRRTNRILDQSDIRGPSSLPLLGGAHHFMRETPESIFDFQEKLIRNYGKTWRIWALNELAIGTSELKVLEELLSSQQLITKNRLYELLHGWLGTGLLMSTGKKWHKRRKIITPTFHFKILEQFVEVFDRQSAVMAQKLQEKADGKSVVNVYPIVCLTALDVIAETAMGVQVNAQKEPDFPYVKSVTTATEITAKRFMQPYQRFDKMFLITAPMTYFRLQKSIEIMHNFTDNVITERRSALEKAIAEGTYTPMAEDNDIGSKRRMALLDVLLQSTVGGQPLSNEDIREEVDTFMFEGHDTTTSGISYTLYLISRHAEVQEKLFREIREVIGDNKDKPIDMRELQDLKYLECVIKESLRLYPSVPMIGRYFSEDAVLGGRTFPAGTNVVVLIYHAMRDPDNFKNPNTFYPERFSAETLEKFNPFAYVPFSAGPRNCIGQKFALLEMKSTISKVLRHFELLPLGEEVRPLMNIVLRSKNGMQVGLKPRMYK